MSKKFHQSEFNNDYFYSCPHCDREHILDISKTEEINYNTKNGSVVEKQVRCDFCKKDFKIRINIKVEWSINWIESTYDENTMEVSQ